MNVEEIIIDHLKDYLKKNGYDGLVSHDGECGCELDDIAPCNDIQLDCSVGYNCAGYNIPCDSKCTREYSRYHITENKPKENKND